MEIRTTELENCIIVNLKGRFDLSSEEEFTTAITSLLHGGKHNFVVNMSSVEYVSSSGLRAVLLVTKKVRGAQGRIFFTELSPQVDQVFDLSGFHRVLDVAETDELAISRL